MRILIIEDEEKLARSLKKGLEQEGFAVDFLLDGTTGYRRLELNHADYDLVILDLMLPGKDGVAICRDLRRNNIFTPILVLTARDSTEDIIEGLSHGADDYLVKPFSFSELLARVHALLRRPRASLPQELRAKDLVLDPTTRAVRRGNHEISLTLKEFALLEYLMLNKDWVVNREQIFAHVWDFAADSFSNVVDVHIKNLRKKVDDSTHEKLLETIRGVGYRIRG